MKNLLIIALSMICGAGLFALWGNKDCSQNQTQQVSIPETQAVPVSALDHVAVQTVREVSEIEARANKLGFTFEGAFPVSVKDAGSN